MSYQPHPQIVPAIVREDYILLLEHHHSTSEGLWRLFVHCHVKRWSASVYKSLRRDFDTLSALIEAPLHALHDPTDAKHAKFVAAGRFKPTGEQWTDIHGRPRELYVRAAPAS